MASKSSGLDGPIKMTRLPSKPVKYLSKDANSKKGVKPTSDEDNEIEELDFDGSNNLDDLDIDSLIADPPKRTVNPFGSGAPPLMTKSGRRSQITIFPTPPSYRMSWGQFSQYWQQCFDNPELRPRMRIYIYRMFPVMLEGFRQVDKLSGDPDASQPEKLAKPMTLEDILHRYGSGDYHFKLNDSGAGNKQVAQCHLENNTRMRDWTNYPPALDLNGVDTADPANKNFLIQIRRHRQQAEEGDMESAKVIERMSDRMLELAERNNRSGGESEASRVMAEAAKQAISIVADTARQHTAQSQNPQNNSNVMDLLGGFMALAKEMRPPDNSLSALVGIMQQTAEREQAMAQRHTELLMTLLKDSTEARKAVLDKPEKGPIEQLKELAESREALRGILGGGGSRRGPDWMEALPALAPAINSGMQAIQYAAMAFFNKQVGQTGTVNGMPNPGAPGQPGAPGMAMLGPGQQGTPGVPGAPGTAGTITEPDILVELQDPQQLVAFLDQLRRPLLRMLNSPDDTGADFAYWFSDWRGEEAYFQVAGLGKDVLTQLLNMYPPIANEITGRGEAVSQFLDEFIGATKEGDTENENSDDEGDKDGENENGIPLAASSPYVHEIAGRFEYPLPEPSPKPGSAPDAESVKPRPRTVISINEPAIEPIIEPANQTKQTQPKSRSKAQKPKT